ncbi:MAG: transcription antitermination factor NusB [Nitrospirae bacterium]|nr:transcription antitermination factor NusB [Nitrospirota bacterium]
MKRRRARENAFQALFRLDFTDKVPDDTELQHLCEDKDSGVISFCMDIVSGTMRNLKEIDSVIKNVAEHWVIERMAVVDRNILRAAVYELLYRDDIPPKVTINEAIEIAKKYSTEESSSFINGILDKISKRR